MKTKLRHATTCPHCGEEFASREVYVPIEGFTAEIDGAVQVLNPGHRFREGHPVLERYPEHFKRIRVQYDVEEATDEPGGKR